MTTVHVPETREGAPDARRPQVTVASLGSEYRRDDGAGPAVARLVARALPSVRLAGPLTDPLDLLGVWDGSDLAVVVDAVRSGARPGSITVVELDTGCDASRSGHPSVGERGPACGANRPGAASTHGVGLAGVLRLARALGTAPRRVVVVGIEGREFSPGVGLTSAVAAAVGKAAARVLAIVEERD